MAFPAVVSVDQIIEHLLHSGKNLLLACDGSQKSEMESFHIKIRFLKSCLEKIYPVRRSIRDEVKDLESEIREKVYESQDLIEAFISHSAFLQPLEENTEKLDLAMAATTSSKLTLVRRALDHISHSIDQLHRDDFPEPTMVKFLCVKIRSGGAAELESEFSDEARKLLKACTSRPVFTKKLVEELDAIVAKAKKIADSMKEEPSSANADQSSTSLTSLKPSRASESSKIVGQEEDLKELKKEIMSEAPYTRVISITGLPGIGKTTLARSLYEDEEVVDRFAIRSWVTVGQEYNPREIFSKLLASIESSKGRKIDGPGSSRDASAEQLALQLRGNLLNSRYLVVVDDLWQTNVWDRIKNYFPGKDYCSRVIVTTRTNIFDDDGGQIKSDFSYRMKLLGKDKSWELLRQKALGGHFCRPELVDELEGIGRSIAEHCDGLPLSITVVGGQLSQEPENIEYWKIVADDTEAAARLEKDNYIEILSRSYEHLPSRLKGCFLYMGAFPEDSEIPVSKLVKLWVAEGFLLQVESSSSSSSSSSLSLENNAEKCLIDLVDRNLVFPIKFGSDGRIKTCGMHDSIRLLAEDKSADERFFYSIKKFPSQKYLSTREVSDPLKGKQTQRRLSVHKNILMCMDDVYESAKTIKPARTLLYAGHYHHHPLPSCLTYEWLRVLDALAVHLVEFPDELVDLVHLRYLALTYNGRLPASLCRLKNLLVLIVRRHPKIIITRKSILPMEIWFMKQLRHIILTECDFPDLPSVMIQDFPLLENLQSLSNINAAGCTRDIFNNIPNLKKLGVWIESPASVNLYLEHLQELEVFKLAVLKAVVGKEIAFQEGFSFPQKLKKLSLSGCGLPWSRLADIGEFPCLQVLKLRQFAFQGPEWIPEDGQFPELKSLVIECLDLETLVVGYFCCGNLESLIIKNCYELKTIDEVELESIGALKQVELTCCNYAAVRSVEKTREAMRGSGAEFQLRVYSSWGEESSSQEDLDLLLLQ